MPNVGYFEIPVDDMAGAHEFYQSLFQWTFERMPGTPDEIDYWAIDTGTPNEPGLSCGGMMKRQVPTHQMTPYVMVDSIENYVQKAEALNALILVPKTAVPGKGYFAIFLDPQKNPIGLWVCDESAQ